MTLILIFSLTKMISEGFMSEALLTNSHNQKHKDIKSLYAYMVNSR